MYYNGCNVMCAFFNYQLPYWFHNHIVLNVHFWDNVRIIIKNTYQKIFKSLIILFKT
jgi:hypothetical protein